MLKINLAQSWYKVQQLIQTFKSKRNSGPQDTKVAYLGFSTQNDAIMFDSILGTANQDSQHQQSGERTAGVIEESEYSMPQIFDSKN